MGEVTCELCPRGCVIPEGGAGDCRVRVNLGGRLRATRAGWSVLDAVVADLAA